jgi:hypothetical protein
VFDPDEAALVLFFNPNDPENIQASLELTVEVYEVAYVSAKNGDEQMQVSNLDLTVAVYDINSNPV